MQFMHNFRNNTEFRLTSDRANHQDGWCYCFDEKTLEMQRTVEDKICCNISRVFTVFLLTYSLWYGHVRYQTYDFRIAKSFRRKLVAFETIVYHLSSQISRVVILTLNLFDRHSKFEIIIILRWNFQHLYQPVWDRYNFWPLFVPFKYTKSPLNTGTRTNSVISLVQGY